MASVTHFTHFYASPTDELSHFMTYSQVLSSWNKYLNGGKLGTWKFSETRYSWDSLLNSDTFLRKGGTYRLLVPETTFFNVRFADNRHSLRNFWLVFKNLCLYRWLPPVFAQFVKTKCSRYSCYFYKRTRNC